MDELALKARPTDWVFFLMETDASGHKSIFSESEDGTDSYPRMFLDSDSVHERAVALCHVESDCVYETRSEPWLPALLHIWNEGAPGVVLDVGGGVSLPLDRTDVRALIMAFAVEWFVWPSELSVVMNQGRVHYKQTTSERKLAYVFTSKKSAKQDLESLLESDPDLSVAPVDATLLLEGTLSAGVDRLILDTGLPTEHSLSTKNLEALRDIRLSNAAGEHGATADSFVASDSAPSTPSKPDAGNETIDRERTLGVLESDESNFLDSIVPSQEEIDASVVPAISLDPIDRNEFRDRRTPREAHARLLQIKALADAEPEQSWRATESFAMDLDMWVPFERGEASDQTWPSTEIAKDAAGQEVVRISIYTSEDEGLRSLARKSQPFELAPMTSIEAFRWIWSAPSCPVEIMIDPFGEDGGVRLHRNSLPSMLFPPILGIKQLALVPELPFERLGDVTWLHGLKPEVIRSLSLNWRNLLGPPLTGAQSEIEYGGKRYLPMFSDDEHYRDFVRYSKTQISRPLRRVTDPPFMNWLRLSGRCDGLVLDPPADGLATDKTLTLDAVEMFHIQLWAKLMHQPEGCQVIEALAKLQRGDYSAEQRVCGMIAADWPLYLAGIVRSGEGYRLIKVPETDELALFTGERELAEFKRSFRSKDPSLDDVESHHMLPRWGANFFRLANQKFSGVCINPGGSTEPNGVQLDGKGLDGALERLDLRLRPRVAGF